MVFANHHTEVLRHMDKGSTFEIKKRKMTEVVFMKPSHYERLKEEVSLHCRNVDGKTSSTCIPRRLGQKLG